MIRNTLSFSCNSSSTYGRLTEWRPPLLSALPPASFGYVEEGGQRVRRAEFEANLAHKLADQTFTADIEPLLGPHAKWNLGEAARYVRQELLPYLPGEPWKGDEA